MIWFKSSNNIKWFIDSSNESIENSKDDADNLDLKWKIVYAYYTRRWWLKSISGYYKQNIEKVIEIITDFKIAASKRNRIASNYPYSFRRKVTNQHIDAVKEFLIKHKGEHFTIDMIQFYLKEEYLELPMISDWSIRKILNQNLKYSYKKICLVHKKMITTKYLRVFFESAYSLASLEERGYELMYLDEFALNFRNKSVYGWGPKGNNGFRYNYIDNMKMFFMIGFSINRVYGVFRTTTTHNHKSFTSFVSNILEYRTNIQGIS